MSRPLQHSPNIAGGVAGTSVHGEWFIAQDAAQPWHSLLLRFSGDNRTACPRHGGFSMDVSDRARDRARGSVTASVGHGL